MNGPLLAPYFGWVPPDVGELLVLVDAEIVPRERAGRLLLWLLIDRYFEPGYGLSSRSTWYRCQRELRELGIVE